MARAPVGSAAAERAEPERQRTAEHPVRADADDAAGDEGPDRRDQPVVVGIVEDAARDRVGEHPGDPGEPDDREQRLLPRVDVVALLVAQSREDRLRVDEDRGHAQPPLTLEGHESGA